MAEKESNAAAAAGNAGRWEGSPVILLPAGSAAVRSKFPHHRPASRSQQREKEQQQPGAGAEVVGEPPEKVFYKTRLCEKFESSGRCAYEDGCTFAHGHAELRPPLSLPAGARRSRLAPLPPPADGGGSAVSVPSHFSGAGKVCFEFRDKGTCHYGDACSYAHASASADMRYPKVSEPAARRSATPPGRAFSVGSSIYGPATARAFPPDSDAAGQGKTKPTRLELLSRKKMSGIYGDWPEGF